MVNSTRPGHCLLLNVGVVAQGSRCLSIMRDLRAVKPTHLRLKLVAMATLSKSAACNQYAGETGIELFEHPILEHIEMLMLFANLNGKRSDVDRCVCCSVSRFRMGIIECV